MADNLWMHDRYAHIRIPKALMYSDRYRGRISPEAMILYGALMDRTSLSVKKGNSFYCRPDGTVRVIFTLQEVMDLLQCRKDKARKLIGQLRDCGLICQKRQGQGRPNVITVVPIRWQDVPWTRVQSGSKISPEGPIHGTAEDGKALPADGGKPAPNNPDMSNPDSIDPEHLGGIEKQIDYEMLADRYGKEQVDDLLYFLERLRLLERIRHPLDPGNTVAVGELFGALRTDHMARALEAQALPGSPWIDPDTLVLAVLMDAVAQDTAA